MFPFYRTGLGTFEPDLLLMTGQESIARVHIEHRP